jgi:hypothetical protein
MNLSMMEVTMPLFVLTTLPVREVGGLLSASPLVLCAPTLEKGICNASKATYQHELGGPLNYSIPRANGLGHPEIQQGRPSGSPTAIPESTHGGPYAQPGATWRRVAP